ncbi:patatin-like phospholipase family protein [Microbacterium saperdae]|uniref:NTE family protein n=1 Tax=Microbacterium saperdae TaxID=69368 RepID=A0A543BB69_9MICO|nr:patatin-like phospholipase family protein [Microbacterium saperdae]TQL82089.1 NTE family protein [Microbacterium saperdae]
MNTPSLSSSSRALVLGGGGSTGNAWLIGIIAGLFDSGVDVTSADLTIGTSAGATAAAQIAGANPSELYAATVVPIPPRPSRGSVVDHMDRMHRLIAASSDAAELRRRLAASALDMAAADSPRQEQWREMVSVRFAVHAWPERRMLLTAVDAETAEPVVFDRDSGVDLVDAVAASCSSGFAYRIGDRRYIDGGFRRNENADLAAGYAKVLVLPPFGGRALTPPAWGLQLDAQVAELGAGGSEVLVVSPGEETEHLFFENAMDVSLRAPAAEAGYAQGRAVAEGVGEFWG